MVEIVIAELGVSRELGIDLRKNARLVGLERTVILIGHDDDRQQRVLAQEPRVGTVPVARQRERRRPLIEKPSLPRAWRQPLGRALKMLLKTATAYSELRDSAEIGGNIGRHARTLLDLVAEKTVRLRRNTRSSVTQTFVLKHTVVTKIRRIGTLAARV